MTNRLANRNREERPPRVTLDAALHDPEAALDKLHADDTGKPQSRPNGMEVIAIGLQRIDPHLKLYLSHSPCLAEYSKREVRESWNFVVNTISEAWENEKRSLSLSSIDLRA